MVSAIGVAMGIGIAVAVQAAVLGRTSRIWHPLSISLALQLAGLVAGGVWASNQRMWAEVWQVTTQWWWLFLGALGWGIVAALGLASARLGVSVTLAIVVSSQVIGGLVLDQISGEVGLGASDAVGAVLLVTGVLLLTSH